MIKREKKRNDNSMTAERLIRKPVHIPALVVADGQAYKGYIINISAYGVGMFIDTDLPDYHVHLKQGTLLRVEFTTGNNNDISLQCIIRWFSEEGPEEKSTTRIGMEVVGPPPEFVQLFDKS